MKEGTRKRLQAGRVVPAAAALLLVAGIVLTVLTFGTVRRNLYAEHDGHLKDITAAVDHNVSAVMARYRDELKAIVSESARKDGETALQTGDASVIEKVGERSPALASGYAADLVVTRDGVPVFAMNEEDPATYSFPHGSGEMYICYNARLDNNCLAIRAEGGNGFAYFALIDLEIFYRRVVTHSIYEDYWIVLYDAGSDLTLQNDYTQPEYKIFSKDEMRERADGYSTVLKVYELGESGASSYRFTDEEGDTYDNRMYVIPAALTENGVFTVGVAVYDNSITAPMRRMTVLVSAAAFAVCFAGAALIFFLLHNGRREIELAEELRGLEKKNALNEKLLEQQQELVHHRKMEIVGAMTAGVAHEFNNLLSPIMAESLLIMEACTPGNEEIMDGAAAIYEASLKAKELTLSISKLTRKDAPQHVARASAAALMQEAMKLAETAVPNNVNVEKRLESDAFVMGDAARLEHMLLNLIINGLQAMEPDGGTLMLSVRDEGANVLFTVCDTGCGIPEGEQERIFDPFYTTKETGRGTGLGLAIVQGTAAASGGTVTAKNKPEGGACFTVTLPKSEEPAEA